MFEFVSKALLSLVLDKRARAALEAADNAPPTPPSKNAAPAAPAAAASAKRSRSPELTDERRELILNALAVQRSKQHVFDELSEDAKAKLLVAAVKAMGIPPEEIERSLRRRKGPLDPKR